VRSTPLRRVQACVCASDGHREDDGVGEGIHGACVGAYVRASLRIVGTRRKSLYSNSLRQPGCQAPIAAVQCLRSPPRLFNPKTFVVTYHRCDPHWPLVRIKFSGPAGFSSRQQAHFPLAHTRNWCRGALAQPRVLPRRAAVSPKRSNLPEFPVLHRNPRAHPLFALSVTVGLVTNLVTVSPQLVWTVRPGATSLLGWPAARGPGGPSDVCWCVARSFLGAAPQVSPGLNC
jgi:hypothetical protein